MPFLVSPVGLLLVLAWSSSPTSDPCGVAGTYALDRAPIVAGVVDSMDESLADLGARPEAGTLAEIRWSAQKEAYESVRGEALDGGIVPHMTLTFSDDGRVAHRTAGADDGARDEHAGRWQTDAACRTVTIDMGDETPTVARIENGRLVFPDDPDRRRGVFSGLAFDRVR